MVQHIEVNEVTLKGIDEVNMFKDDNTIVDKGHEEKTQRKLKSSTNVNAKEAVHKLVPPRLPPPNVR